MISVEQALELVLQHTGSIARISEVDSAAALGCTLAEDIASDIDSPPHDKSQVDGFALHESDLANSGPLQVIERVVAGEVPKQKSPKIRDSEKAAAEEAYAVALKAYEKILKESFDDRAK